MLLTRQIKKNSRPVLHLAAMIDVVFLLLIFFMCTMSFHAPEKNLPAQMPALAQPVALEEFPPTRVWIRQTHQGHLLTCDDQPCGDFTALHAMLSARRRIADVPVVIGSDQDIPFGLLVNALDTCYDVGLTRVAFSARAQPN